MVDAARTEGDADYWKGRMIVFTSGNIAGQCAIITDFNAGTDTFTFSPALTQAVATQTYAILSAVSVWDDVLAEHLTAGTTGAALNAAGSAGDPWNTALPGAYGAGTAGKIIGDNLNATISSRATQTSVDTIDDFLDTEITDIRNRLPAALVGGRMDSSVGAMAADVLTAAAINAAAFTSAKFAAGAIDAAALAADAVTEIRDAITGGAWALSTDANGRIRIVDGTGAGELDTSSGSVSVFDFTTAAKALLEAEANDAIVANHLDHLLAADYDPASKPGVATALLNELVESDGGVSRFTANALEQAPAGGGGGGSTIVVTPVASTVSAGVVDSNDLVAYQFSGFTFIFAIVDDTGAPVNLAGKTTKFIAHLADVASTHVFTINGSVGGANNNQVTVTSTDANTQLARTLRYVLRNETDDIVLAIGSLEIRRAGVAP
jgi:hypothetical protein